MGLKKRRAAADADWPTMDRGQHLSLTFWLIVGISRPSQRDYQTAKAATEPLQLLPLGAAVDAQVKMPKHERGQRVGFAGWHERRTLRGA